MNHLKHAQRRRWRNRRIGRYWLGDIGGPVIILGFTPPPCGRPEHDDSPAVLVSPHAWHDLQRAMVFVDAR